MKKILLVDDDPICNLLMTKFLDRIDTPKTIKAVINGVQAVDLLKEYLPDIIFLDLNMPIMNGFEFIEAFKKLDLSDQKNVKIVIVSSSVSLKDIDQAKKLGIDKFLVKPVTIEQLEVVIK